ncbi:MAG: hypothetical protein CMF49_08615 [Legionellales bacterium]|nr:hypothetical protein [Legionellales bacterium]
MTLLNKISEILFLETAVAKNGFRIAVGMVLAASIAIVIHAENPYWAVFSVILMMQSTLGASLERGLLRLLGTFVGVALGYFLAGLVVNYEILYYLTVFLVITLANYLSLNSKYPYGFIVLGITVYIILAALLMNTQTTYQFAIWRGIEIAIGVVCGWIVMFFLFPVRASQQLEHTFKQNKQLTMQILSEAKKALHEQNYMDDGITYIHQLNKNIVKLRSLQSIIPKEIIQNEFKVIYFNAMTEAQLTQINFVKDIYLFVTEHKVGRRVVQQILNVDDIFDLFIELLNIEDQQQYLAQCHQIQILIDQSKKAWDTISDEDLNQYEVWENINFYSLLNSLQALLGVCEKESNIQNENYQLAQITKKAEKTKKSIFKTLLRYDVDFLKASIKVGLSSVIAIYIWSQTNWPIGIMGVISAFIIAIQKNIYDVQLQGELRFLGAMVGGAIGLACLYFFVYDFPVLILSLFIFGWIFGYLSSTESRYAYAALQANMALAITLVNGQSPLLTIEPAMQRVGGVLFGIAVAFLVARFIWPVHPKQLLKKLANKIFKLEKKIFDNILSTNKKIESTQLSQAISEYLNLLTTFKVYRHDDDNDLKQAILIRRILCRLSTIILTLSYKTDYSKAKVLANFYHVNLDQAHHAISELIDRLEYDGLTQQFKQTVMNVKEDISQMLNKIRSERLHMKVKKSPIDDGMSLFQLLEAYLRLLNSLLNTLAYNKKR